MADKHERPVSDLPDWAQSLFAEFLRLEMVNEQTMPHCSTLEDTHKAFEMVMRAYVAGYRDRTKMLRPLPRLRDPYPPQEKRKGPPPLPQGPYQKGR